MARIIITMDCGVIQQLFSNDDIEVVVINYDIENYDKALVVKDPQQQDCFIGSYTVEELDEDEVNEIFKITKCEY